MGLGDVLSAAFAILKKKLWLFVGLALIPQVIVYAAVIVGVIVMATGLAAQAGQSSPSPTAVLGAFVPGTIIMLVGALVAAFVQLKMYGMMAAAAHETAAGGDPTFASTSEQSRGLMGRVIPVYLLGVLVGLVVVGIVSLPMILGIAGAASSSNNETVMAAVMSGVALTMLLMIGVYIGIFFLIVKFLYFMPVLAVERLGGMDALRRSWRLTRGSFWRTLGFYLIGAMIVSGASFVAQMIGQVVSMLFQGTGSANGSDDPAAVAAQLVAVLPALIVTMLFQLAISLLSYPFLLSYTTVMYIDQVRRDAGAVAVPYGLPYGSMYAPAPGQMGAPGAPGAPQVQPGYQATGQPWQTSMPGAPAAPPAPVSPTPVNPWAPVNPDQNQNPQTQNTQSQNTQNPGSQTNGW